MKLQSLDVIVTGNPPPGFGGRYFTFVKVTTACGIVGWGEVYAASVGPRAMTSVIEDVFARHLEGEDPFELELLFRRVYSSGFSQRPDPTVMGAFSGLEIACRDIQGKALDVPVWRLLGGRVTPRLRLYSYLYPTAGQDPATFYGSPELSAEAAAAMVEAGFTAVKFDPAGPYTIRGGHQPSLMDLDRCEAFCRQIRSAVGSKADLLFGTHGQFTASGAIRLARRIEPWQPLWLEEPVPPDDVAGLATVARATSIPIATGERLTTLSEVATVLRAGGASILQPALGRVGGIGEAKKIAALAEAFGAQIAPHVYAGPIEWVASVHLGTSLPNLLLLETIGAGDAFHRELLKEPLDWESGYVRPPEGPGLGVELDEAVARAHPYRGERLHLEMQEEPIDYRGENRFGGG